MALAEGMPDAAAMGGGGVAGAAVVLVVVVVVVVAVGARVGAACGVVAAGPGLPEHAAAAAAATRPRLSNLETAGTARMTGISIEESGC
jgi:hypothetical protein